MTEDRDAAVLAAFFRFVAERTDRGSSPEVTAMMEELARAADAIEATGGFTAQAGRLRITARALAGVAGFLQQHILPEAVAAGNTDGERQVRWVIDTCMETMAALTTHAEVSGEGENYPVSLA